jgi:beta-galactosidase GanA
MRRTRISSLTLAALLAGATGAARARAADATKSAKSATSATSASSAMPRIVQKDGRYALLVDGAPFLMLGAQINNSSAWPAVLPQVWPAIKAIHANTVEMPVYWEQFEPKPGAFDYTVVDTLVAQSRKNGVHLVLLWFATWKNNGPAYAPLWLKEDPKRFARMLTADGRPIGSISPFSTEMLEADKHAFVALMRHLKKTDPRHTVILVQVENESGTWGAVRDYSPAALKAFAEPVPAPILAAMGKKTANPNVSWKEAFGKDADEFFHAWAVARYVGEVAAAGKAEYPLPLYANAALRDPISPGPTVNWESGGPTDDVLPIWKAAAPALDFLAPDIYMDDYAKVDKVMELYRRPDNPLLIPEISNAPQYARFFFLALGHQTLGFSPFGIDFTNYANFPLGAKKMNDESLAPFALNYQLVGPMMRELARLGFEGKVHGVAEKKGTPAQSLEVGAWKVDVRYGLPQFGFGDKPPGNPEPVGGAFVARLADNQFLVSGFHCRVDFQTGAAAPKKQRDYVRVEEGTYESGAFKFRRLWNGDQTDWGLNFTSEPVVLRVTLGTY